MTGYNLAYSMGIKNASSTASTDLRETADVVTLMPAHFCGVGSGGQGILSHQVNDAFVAVNVAQGGRRGLLDGIRGASTARPSGRRVRAGSGVHGSVLRNSDRKGVSFDAVTARPSVELMKLNPVRIVVGHLQRIDTRWMRWLLEHEFPFRSYRGARCENWQTSSTS